MKLPRPPLYPTPLSRPRRPSPLAPPSASEALLRRWLHHQICVQLSSVHSLHALPVFSGLLNQDAQRAGLSITKSQRPITVGGDPAAPALSGVSGRVLGSFTTFLPRPPSGWTALPGLLGLRPHTALFTEGRFRAPRGDNQHCSARERDRAAGSPGNLSAHPPSGLCGVRNKLLWAPGQVLMLCGMEGSQVAW